MALRARLELEDSFAREQACTICGQPALSVVHLKGFPDYVTCARCGAAFVMEEGGQRAMYGSIPPEYPETRDFALKKWTSLEAIAALAEAERPRPAEDRRGAQELAAVPVAAPLPKAGLLAGLPRVEIPEADPEAPLAEPPVVAEPVVAPEPSLEPIDWPEPAAEAQASSAPDGAPEPFGWPPPAAEAEPAAGAEPPDEPFSWPAPAPEAQPASGAEPPDEPFEWPTPAAQAESRIEAEAEPAAVPPPAAGPFTWPPAPAGPEPTPEPVLPPEPLPSMQPAPADAGAAEPVAKVAPEPAPPEQVLEPPAGRRFRVRYMGTQARIPPGICTHCLRTTARRNLVVAGVATGPDGQPRRATFTLPLCNSCYRRARARSDEERSARLMAHLTSVLLGAVVMVSALALGLVTFATSPLVDVALLAVLGLCGYGIPALLLLSRSGRMPPPEDALFVRSTLLVGAQPGAGETLFDWRNPGTASRFQEANPGETGDTIFEVADPLARPKSSHHEPDS